MKTPILGSSYVARSVNAADNRMINLFPEIVAEARKEPAFLQRAPGLRLITTAGVGPIRGMWQFNGRSFVVSGGFLYQLTSDWRVIQIGEIGGTGSVSMADNGNQLFIAANPEAFIYNVTTRNLQRITDPDFPGAVTVGYIDGYFVFNEPNSQRIWITSIYDGTNIDALDFASAEGSPDNIVAVIVDHREVWLFGTNSVEVWYNSGNPDFPLSRIQGAFNELGCVAPYSVAKLDNTIFWLGADARGRGIVYKAKGYTGERISTHAVEWQIQQYANMGDAIGYTYQQDGHAFYVLVFPSANTTWVYDASTQVWHERAGWDGARFTRHRGNCQMSYNSEIVIGDYENGNLYAFDLNYYQDNGGIQKWLRSWRALPTGQNNLKRTTQHSLQLDCETGATLYSDDFSGFYQLITENGYTIVTEFNQIYIQTENAEFLTTESGDELVLINYPEPYPDGYTLITEEEPPAMGADPQVMLRWSDDSGHTWSSEHWKSMGRIGQFGYRTIWRRLGMTLKIRDRVYEVSGTDPVKIAIVGAELILDPTNA